MSHSIYIGLVLVAPILNQKRYEVVFNEILQYLQTHQQELHIQIVPNRFLIFQSSSGNSSDQVTLPLSPLYLHTTYYRLHTGFQLNNEDKKFATIAWEVLNILKENFPSKIFLTQENIEQCKPIFIPMSQSEELRRQISCLLSIKEEGRPLSHDELEDTWFTLQFSQKVNDQRALNTCLDLIQAHLNQVSKHSLLTAKTLIDIDTLSKIVNKNDYTQLTSNKMIAQEIMQKLNKISQDDDNVMNESIQRQLNENELDLSDQYGSRDHDRPTSTRMCLFQLSESNDLNRVTAILETLNTKSRESLVQMRKKYQLNSKLLTIMKKYCNADYGFDQPSSRQGRFQFNLIKLMIALAQDYAVFLEDLNNQCIDYLSQLIEEGIIFVYEEAISGQYTQSLSQVKKQGYLVKFLKLSLDFIELAVSKTYAEYLPLIRESLHKVLGRLCKLIQKKDNPLLALFLQNQGSQMEQSAVNLENYQSSVISQNINETLSGDQLNELRSLSENLYLFAVDLSNRIMRVEALSDLHEEHEDKHQRLFYKLVVKGGSQGVLNNDRLQLEKQHQTKLNIREQNKTTINDRINDYNTLKEVFNSNQYYQQDGDRKTKAYDNYPLKREGGIEAQEIQQNKNYITSNVFLKNQIEQNYKRVVSNQHNTSTSRRDNKENQNNVHFIGEDPVYHGREQYSSNVGERKQGMNSNVSSLPRSPII